MTYVLAPLRGGGAGPAGTDRFAPRIIVGNEPAGDPAVDQAAPFQYIHDPGDGSGIEAALAALAAGPELGTVFIRRGEYDLSLGAVADLQVPDGVTIIGEGEGTVLLGRTAGSQRVFRFEGAGALRQLRIDVPTGDVGATGGEVILVDGGAVDIDDVSVAFDGDSDTNLRAALRVSGAGAVTLRAWSSTTSSTSGGIGVGTYFVHIDVVGGAASEDPFGELRGDDITTIGGDIPLRAGGVMHVSRVRSTGWRVAFVVMESAAASADMRVHDVRATSSGAAYGGVTGVLGEAPAGGTSFELSSARISSGTATPTGFDVAWAVGAAIGVTVRGPTLRDVEFSGFNGAVYGGGDPVSGCYHANVRFSRCLNADALVIQSSTDGFIWEAVDAYVLCDAGFGNTCASINGDDHQFLNCVFICETTVAAGFGVALALINGTRCTIVGGDFRAQGENASSRVIACGSQQTRIIGASVRPIGTLGGPAVSLDGSVGVMQGCQVPAFAFTGTGVLISSDENIVAGNMITMSAATAVAAIDVSGDNNNITNNINRDVGGAGVDGIVDTGTNNEIFGNIAT